MSNTQEVKLLPLLSYPKVWERVVLPFIKDCLIDSPLPSIRVFYPYPHHIVEQEPFPGITVDVENPSNLIEYLDKIRYNLTHPVDGRINCWDVIYLSRVLEHNSIRDSRYLFYIMKPLTTFVIVLVPDMERIAKILSQHDPNEWAFERLCFDIFNEPIPGDPFSCHRWWTTEKSVVQLAQSEGWEPIKVNQLEVDFEGSVHVLITFRKHSF